MIIRNRLFVLIFIIIQSSVSAEGVYSEQVSVTKKQARALQSLNTPQDEKKINSQVKTLRLQITKLSDNQGQQYLGAIISNAELAPYLAKLAQLLGDKFQSYRALQAARDHQLFHMTLLSPSEYQLADEVLIEKLFAADVNTNSLNVTLLGLGKVEQDNKQTYFVVAQSGDAQLLRQQFLLPMKDFHVTLAFNPSDIYGVNKDSSTLLK